MSRWWCASTLLALGCSGPVVLPGGAGSSSGEAESSGTTTDPPTVTTTSSAGPAPTGTTVGTVRTTGASTDDPGDSTGLSGFIIAPDGGVCGDGFCPGAEGVSARSENVRALERRGASADSPQGPTVHLAAEGNIEEITARVKKAGGTVVSDVISIPAGRFIYAKDLDGNSVGFFETKAG